MPKSRTIYTCNQCGAESSQWFGKCPACDSWDSLVEQVSSAATVPGRPSLNSSAWMREGDKSGKNKGPAQPRAAVKLSQISDAAVMRWTSSYGELDRVLGGGIVPGSLVLIGGEPGIGKSTLLLQVANQLSYTHRVLYVSGEESGQQVKLRAARLGVGKGDTRRMSNGKDSGEMGNGKAQRLGEEIEASQATSDQNFYLLPETDLEEILREMEALKPNLAVIDSIQTIYFPSLTSAPGSVAQVRECTSALMQVAKRENITLFIVGHVTKDGAIAGPRVLEHLVDTVLYFEGDRFASHRLLRSMKNRFGATHEIGVFEMVAQGLDEVANPSELFLGNRDEFVSGTATIVACEGTRPIVVELQALVSPTSYGSPRRSTTGVESNRLLQILAVLEKRVGIPLSKLDAYVASAGGLGVEEPAADLGIAVAVVASFRDRRVDPRTVLIGEVGLGGQVRAVSQLELRLKEAAKLGFKRAIVPKGQSLPDMGLTIIPVSRVLDAIIAAIPAQLRSEAEEPEEEFEE
ncbi:DNA repair protein RadA [Desertifilum sp. FACHB-1129]|uniref:DNA repair protein RadA n=1 Tax=Desertifilum tharense IPPAS B-1220 TaxID=1781255 RepID=A0A1E5QHU3_9CYAN|nr:MULTISPECIES: DNA repair protein RadA [Desertifilum]MDA0212385.1 DNA repair protein RadA [Cyanobacteria bacterium FC1]MBD2311739.1 DNA repair protein RadA [Desertifilum sp. FACHB-1129]MBD2322736.1 DNA repair protein RadA [Desertifilum sp. FACHB-866]MBD2332870.1 DNA repair protein RadA [Desertifilum sp. FACHB-868]OEJ74188.1 DNA repair protein RadA [Desertifilum tharense IPPAS B-1220]